jgi:hypothetical protein
LRTQGNAKAFLTKSAKHVAASKGEHDGELLASWRRKVPLSVHVTRASNAMRGLSSAVDGWPAARSFLLPATPFITRAIGRKRLRVSARAQYEALLIAFPHSSHRRVTCPSLHGVSHFLPHIIAMVFCI